MNEFNVQTGNFKITEVAESAIDAAMEAVRSGKRCNRAANLGRSTPPIGRTSISLPWFVRPIAAELNAVSQHSICSLIRIVRARARLGSAS